MQKASYSACTLLAEAPQILRGSGSKVFAKHPQHRLDAPNKYLHGKQQEQVFLQTQFSLLLCILLVSGNSMIMEKEVLLIQGKIITLLSHH